MIKTWPPFSESGDLPSGVHTALLSEVVDHFGHGTPERAIMAWRLGRIFDLAMSTGFVRRFVVFGSFVTAKPEPGDVDVFLIMDDGFDVGSVPPEILPVFDHGLADRLLGASIFWIRLCAAFDGEEAAIAFWQAKRDGKRRGIVEIVSHDQ